MDSPNNLAHLGVRNGRYRARVEHSDVALFDTPRLLKPRLKKLLLEGRAIRLTRPATEAHKVERGHKAKSILAEPGGPRQRPALIRSGVGPESSLGAI